MIQVILAISILGSFLYARSIFARTIAPQWVWLSVVIGSFFYGSTLGLLLFTLIEMWTGHRFVSLIYIPLGWYVIWGTPMIFAEIKKHFGMLDEATQVKLPTWKGEREQ